MGESLRLNSKYDQRSQCSFAWRCRFRSEQTGILRWRCFARGVRPMCPIEILFHLKLVSFVQLQKLCSLICSGTTAVTCPIPLMGLAHFRKQSNNLNSSCRTGTPSRFMGHPIINHNFSYSTLRVLVLNGEYIDYGDTFWNEQSLCTLLSFNIWKEFWSIQILFWKCRMDDLRAGIKFWRFTAQN